MATKSHNISILSVLFLLTLTLNSCFEDNYDGPNANFHGTLIDVTTNEAMPSEQPNGFQIQFRELSWGTDASSQTIYGKPDGTFNYDYLFGYTNKKYEGSPYNAATYEITPISGAFEIVGQAKDTIEVYPNSKVEVNFYVQPYIELTLISSTLEDTVLTVSYSMSRPIYQTSRITASAVVMSSKTQYLSANLNTGGWEDKYTARKQAPNLITYTDGKVITETIHLDRGKTYWMRLAANSSKSSYWNYSKTTELTISK